jgi:radical SAM protein with 4Fe4S-binding SPASM domain
MLVADTRGLKERLIDRYYELARGTQWGRHVHQALRRWNHRRKFGIDCAMMFRAVEIEVNSMCNRKCTYCPNVTDKRPPAYMDETLFQKVIDELGAIGFDGRVSYHFYGEPLLDKRLPRMVEYTTKVAPRSASEIYSNGDFLTLDVFRRYLAVGLEHFLITQHDNVVPANLQEILDKASPAEQKHLTIRFAKDRLLINRSGLIKGLAAVDHAITAPCDWPLTTIVITAAGNVVLCCNDYYETEVIGNIKERSLTEIWCDDRFEEFRRALSRGDRWISPLCENCDYVPAASRLKRIVPS